MFDTYVIKYLDTIVIDKKYWIQNIALVCYYILLIYYTSENGSKSRKSSITALQVLTKTYQTTVKELLKRKVWPINILSTVAMKINMPNNQLSTHNHKLVGKIAGKVIVIHLRTYFQ